VLAAATVMVVVQVSSRVEACRGGRFIPPSRRF
jgi:hypothetical protein